MGLRQAQPSAVRPTCTHHLTAVWRFLDEVVALALGDAIGKLALPCARPLAQPHRTRRPLKSTMAVPDASPQLTRIVLRRLSYRHKSVSQLTRREGCERASLTRTVRTRAEGVRSGDSLAGQHTAATAARKSLLAFSIQHGACEEAGSHDAAEHLALLSGPARLAGLKAPCVDDVVRSVVARALTVGHVIVTKLTIICVAHVVTR